MEQAMLAPVPAHSIGQHLQYWRRLRQLSQLALAHEAGVSPRHLCFLETGRARPSREMVLQLAETLGVPLRERNALLLAAGFAPSFRQSDLNHPDLSPVRAALDAILAQQEPYPAVVMNRCWDLVGSNTAADRFFALLLGGRMVPGPPNVLRLMFHPEGIRPTVTNWEEVAEALVQRLHREAVGGVLDEASRSLLAEILDYPGVPRQWRRPELAASMVPVLPVRFRLDQQDFHYFSTVTVLGTPLDITLQELRIECFFPSDGETETAARALATPD